MPFAMPDLKAMAQRARNSFRVEMPGTDAWVWPNNVYVSAKVFAGIVYEVFGRLKTIDRERFMFSASIDGLTDHGIEFAIPRNGASFAQGFVEFPVTFPFTVPAGAFVTRDDGVTYTVTKSISAPQYSTNGLVVAPVICNTVGKVGNAITGTPLTTNLTGLTDAATTVYVGDLGIGSGADIEPVEDYRTRLLARKRQPPMGGASYDYVAWAKQIPGVTRVFVAGNGFGPGTVAVWFLMDDTYLDGVPQPADVETMQAHLDSVSPVTANVIALAPLLSCIDITVRGLSPDTQAIREAVAAEVQTLFLKTTKPGLPGQPFVLRWSWIEKAVSNATGEDYNEGLGDEADQSFGVGIMPCLRSVNFIKA